MDNCCEVRKDKSLPMPKDKMTQLPMPPSTNQLLTLPAGVAAPSMDHEPFKVTARESLQVDRVYKLLQEVAEEQSGLRAIVQHLEETICSRLDALDRSVASNRQQIQHSSLAGLLRDAEDQALLQEAAETQDLEEEANKWFNQIDKDHSGSLTREELKACLTAWSMSAKQTFKDQLNLRCEADVDRLVDAADKDGSGDIDQREFIELVRIRKQEMARSSMNEPVKASLSTLIGKEKPMTFLERIVTSVYFETLITLLILVNLILMVVSLQLKGLHNGSQLGLRPDDINWSELQPLYDFMERLFNGVYLAELILRLSVHLRNCRIGPSDVADTIIVLISCADSFVLTPNDINILNVSVLRLARLGRLARFSRLLRFSEHLSEVRVLLNTLCIAVRGIIWSVVLLASIITTGAIFMTQLSDTFLSDKEADLTDEDKEWLYTNFGTVFASMNTMFECTFTGGWRFMSRRLIEEVHYGFAVFWVLWIILVNFVTMRVIGALFLCKTMKVAANDKEKCAMNQLKRKGELSQILRMMFEAADTSGDGAISEEEFEHMLAHSTVVEDFSKMGLDIDKVRQFFSVLVADDGTADYNEFLSGALAMATSSPAIDTMKTLQHNIKIERDIKTVREAVLPLLGAFSRPNIKERSRSK